MSIASAWSVWIENNNIKFEVISSGYDLKEAKGKSKSIFFPVQIAWVSKEIIQEILNSNN